MTSSHDVEDGAHDAPRRVGSGTNTTTPGIVERLRVAADVCEFNCNGFATPLAKGDILREAADLITTLQAELERRETCSQSQPGYDGERAASADAEPSAVIRANTELLPHLEPSIRPHAQFIDAALTYYHGGPADRDVRDAWKRITDRLTQLRYELGDAKARIAAFDAPTASPTERPALPREDQEAASWKADAADLFLKLKASQAEVARLRAGLGDAAKFIEDLAEADLDDIAADGGITVGMVFQQQARTVFAPRARALLNTEDQPK